MRTALLVCLCCLLASAVATSQPGSEALRVDNLLSINSVVGGETPQWSPDGKHLLFASSLGDGGLLTISPDGGFPTRVPLDLGGSGHFLALQTPQWARRCLDRLRCGQVRLSRALALVGRRWA